MKREHEEAVQEAARKKQKKIEEELARCKDWDVTARWKISFPYVEEQYSDDAKDMSLDIFREETQKGPQMFAKFNFGVTTGVFRFERQKSDKEKAALKKTKKHEEDEDGYPDYDDYYGRRSPFCKTNDMELSVARRGNR
jgi:hypothetical protein